MRVDLDKNRYLFLSFEHCYIYSETAKNWKRGTVCRLIIPEGFPVLQFFHTTGWESVEKKLESEVICYQSDNFNKEQGRKNALRRLFEEHYFELEDLLDKDDRRVVWKAALPKQVILL